MPIEVFLFCLCWWWRRVSVRPECVVKLGKVSKEVYFKLKWGVQSRVLRQGQDSKSFFFSGQTVLQLASDAAMRRLLEGNTRRVSLDTQGQHFDRYCGLVCFVLFSGVPCLCRGWDATPRSLRDSSGRWSSPEPRTPFNNCPVCGFHLKVSTEQNADTILGLGFTKPGWGFESRVSNHGSGFKLRLAITIWASNQGGVSSLGRGFQQSVGFQIRISR